MAGEPLTPRQVPKPPEKPAEPPDAIIAQTSAALDKLKAGIDEDMKRFVARVRELGSDFPGTDDSETLQTNQYFIRIEKDLRAFLESGGNDAPSHIQQAWRKAAVDFMVEKTDSYKGIFNTKTMGYDEITTAFEELKTQIGPFEEWVKKSPFAQEYDTWKNQKTALDAKRTEATEKLAEAKKALGDAAAAEDIKPKLNTLQTALAAADTAPKIDNIIPEIALLAANAGLLARVVTLHGQFKRLPTELVAINISGELAAIQNTLLQPNANTTDLESRLAALDTQYSELENVVLKADAEGLTPEKKAELFAQVKGGKKTSAQAIEELKQGTHQEVPAVAEEEPGIDTLLGWVESIDENGFFGKLKAPLAKLAAGIAAVVAGVAKSNNFIGNWLRGSVISNKLLAEKFGDEKAKLYLTLEASLQKFGLPKKIASMIGDLPIEKFVAIATQHPEKFTKDPEQQQRLKLFCAQLNEKSSDKKISVLAFINSPKGSEIRYRSTLAAAPSTPAATQAAPVTSAQAAAPATAATAPAAAPTATSTPPAAPAAPTTPAAP